MIVMGLISEYDGPMPRDLDVALLRTFVVSADTASMTATANLLHVTQGAISQQIARLESAVNGRLFVRGKLGLRLTTLGERLLGPARSMVKLNDDIWADVTAAPHQGSIRAGIPDDLVGPALLGTLKGFAQHHPDVDVSLISGSSTELAQAFADGEVDLAIIEEQARPGVEAGLGTDQLVWVGARGGTAHLIRPLPVSMVSATCAFRPAVFAALSDNGVSWRSTFENGSVDAMTATVRSDMAVAPMLASSVPPDLSVIGAAALPELPPFAVTMVVGTGEAGRAARELAAWIRSSWTPSGP
jgi:DNA-binding transcriptional LysR family regulator